MINTYCETFDLSYVDIDTIIRAFCLFMGKRMVTESNVNKLLKNNWYFVGKSIYAFFFLGLVYNILWGKRYE